MAVDVKMYSKEKSTRTAKNAVKGAQLVEREKKPSHTNSHEKIFYKYTVSHTNQHTSQGHFSQAHI